MPAPEPRPGASLILFGALLLLLAGPKLVLSAYEHGTSIDGGFYTDVALHVAAGNGLVTDVSLYHHGYPSFPHPTAVYPLWPLIYGYAAKLFPAPEVGIWLSTVFYFVALVFAYLWGRRLVPDPLYPRLFPGLDGGHIVMLVLGLHGEFFAFTSLPYGEGLAWALLMAALWRLHGRFLSPSWQGGAEAGAWCGLLFLARSQMLFVLGSIVAVQGLFLLTDAGRRRDWGLMLGASLTVFVAVLLPHYMYVRSFVLGSAWLAMLRFDSAHVTEQLSEVTMLVKTDGLWDWLVDRFGGFVEAFKWSGKYGYRKAFHWFHWAVPVLAGLGLSRKIREKVSLREWIRWLRQPERAPMALALSVALVGFLSIHAIHKSYFIAWNFTRRQGLTSMFLFALALIRLAQDRHWTPRFLALFLLLNGTGTGYAKAMDKAVRKAGKEHRPYRPGFVRHLHEARTNGSLTVAITGQQGQRLAPHTDGVGYHWIHRRTRTADLKHMVEDLGVTRVFVGKNDTKWRVFKSNWFVRSFAPQGKISGFAVYVLREPDTR